jgi:hypothetical protein
MYPELAETPTSSTLTASAGWSDASRSMTMLLDSNERPAPRPQRMGSGVTGTSRGCDAGSITMMDMNSSR